MATGWSLGGWQRLRGPGWVRAQRRRGLSGELLTWPSGCRVGTCGLSLSRALPLVLRHGTLGTVVSHTGGHR
jgi:hypothetical protein